MLVVLYFNFVLIVFYVVYELKYFLFILGKDGSRALVTGQFNDESNDKDHVLDLSCNELMTILHWRDTFKKKYAYVGMYLTLKILTVFTLFVVKKKK